MFVSVEAGKVPLVREDVSLLGAIADGLTCVLTLSEGLERDELARSRVTGQEVRRQLLGSARAVASLSDAARGAMPELDFAAWRKIAERLVAGDALDSDSSWVAIQALTPATLGWLRFYRKCQPELFGV